MRYALRSRRLALPAILSTLLIVGCLETEIPLTPPEQAKVDRAFVGDFAGGSADTQMTVVIRNLNDREYYVEYREAGKPDITRMVGHLAQVNGVRFAHLRGLPDDGSIEKKYLVMRIELAGDQLSLRNLDEQFFQARPFQTSEQFRQTLEANLDNPELYQGEAVVLKRVAKS